jgi:alpha-N-acetylglucosaminidase
MLTLSRNIVTFSYTGAFWSWEDWELQLDWMALHGINLPLAWVGAEKFLVEVFQEIGFTDAEISTFLSGPAFQSWNRFGNIQGSWNGDLPESWIDEQFSLNQQVVARMVELGMTPVLPSFTGFVPSAISRVQPNASVAIGSQWSGFPTEYTNDSFLEPTDPLFTTLQKSFIAKQQKAYGNVSHIYTLDQYNENDPSSSDPNYLRNISYSTWQSLKAADPQAIWMMQGWLFFSNEAFWTDSLIESWFAGVETDTDMIVLDLFSESAPQWQRTNSYYGKPWIWCQLHDYGGNMGLGGQIMNITIDPIEAVSSSSSLVGFGLTMEGQEQENQIVYDLLLDQAWSDTPIDTNKYFKNWATTRYSGSIIVPDGIYEAWELMRTTVYNNTNLTSSAVSKSLFGLEPSTTGLTNRTGHHPTTINYDPKVLIKAWHLFFGATADNHLLWANPAYVYDLVDITRQVIANEFIASYTDLVNLYSSSSASSSALLSASHNLIALLDTLDLVLSTNENFKLTTWIDQAVAWAGHNVTTAAFYEYNARNQITLWGPSGQISDYASKDWSGLVSTYYKPRWQIFVDYLHATPAASYNATALHDQLLSFELKWQDGGATAQLNTDAASNLETILAKAQKTWPSLFAA